MNEKQLRHTAHGSHRTSVCHQPGSQARPQAQAKPENPAETTYYYESKMNNSSAVPPGQDGGSADTYAQVMESITRIALAGFGGAIAGLSISRRRGHALTMARVDAAVSGGSKRRRRRGAAESSRPRHNQQGSAGAGGPSAPYVDQDLPSTWAFACLTFASITESTRLLSPTTLLGDLLEKANSLLKESTSDRDDEKTNERACEEEGEASTTKSLSQMPRVDISALTSKISIDDVRTISDYIIGGSIAGAVFKGGSIQSSAGVRWAKRAGGNPSMGMMTAAATRTSLMAGLLPGAALGLFAGILQVGAGHLEQMLLEEQATADTSVEANGNVQVRDTTY